MAPGLLSDISDRTVTADSGEAQSYPRKPLGLAGVLDKFQSEDTTPVIGREFTGVNIVDDLLNADDADALLRDLAITSMPHSSELLTKCN